MVQNVSAYAAIPAVYVLLRFLGKCLRAYLLRKHTVLYDIPKLGGPRPDEKRIKGTAVICGGRCVCLSEERPERLSPISFKYIVLLDYGLPASARTTSKKSSSSNQKPGLRQKKGSRMFLMRKATG